MRLDLDPNLKAAYLPDIGVRFVPEGQKNDAAKFYHNLDELQKWSNDFACSLALYDMCEAQPFGEQGPTFLNMRWRFMAARNGGLALRNFSQCLSAARGVVGKVSFWRGKIDVQALKVIEAEFRSRFPEIDKLRHAIAHPEFYGNPLIDMSGSPADMPGLSVGGNITVQDALAFRTYATTINGLTVSYQLSIENARLVLDFTQRAYTAVEQLARDAANSPS